MPEPSPLIKHLYTADPSAHVFNGKLYIYPSHDRETDIAFNDNGDQYDMTDYHVFSMDSLDGPVTDHGIALSAHDVPWVSKQMWAPDAACKNGKYYLFFLRGTSRAFSALVLQCRQLRKVHPAVFVDGDDGEKAYLYFGGLWGGQLQCWKNQGGTDNGMNGLVFDASLTGPHEPSGDGVLALGPRVAQLAEDMLSFLGPPRELEILTESGEPIRADDHERRFFEAAWMHRYRGKYYFSYSTGDSHYLVYATGDSPFGPFIYQGRILEPVLGWTTHHSIVEFQDKWYLFYHDCELSGGVDHLRSVKVREILYDEEGRISLA
ncbi:Xylosidase/arabinosidase [Penicillium maclennaniae]|uniref:Xylosidase/arabinosidase n=1 Tax=Penicillium maclennaniae TaxID=1343394 RepID=UPI0025401302|nr:Xylosidase/arabinosidase [Penicillium maclennaniae]KAJ5677500.1 Xylosidase/arabinosidase [Penicillium maclennaniae]